MSNKLTSSLVGCAAVGASILLGMLIIGGAVWVYNENGAPRVATAATPQATVPPAPQQAQPTRAPDPAAQRAPAQDAAQDAFAVTPQPAAPAAATPLLPPEPPTPEPLPAVATAVELQARPLPTYTPYPTLTPNLTYTPYPTPTPLPTPTALPVVDWQRSGTLEVLNWTTTIVVDKERPKEGVKSLVPGRDRVVLVVTGKLRAGVDLTRVQPQNVQIEGTSIKLVAPKPIITSVELLPDESRVYDAERTWVFSEYTGLEVEAMDEAKRQLGGPNPTNTRMMETAEVVARLQLTNFLRDLGFQKVEIIFSQ
jgi:hypothetical protein